MNQLILFLEVPQEEYHAIPIHAGIPTLKLSTQINDRLPSHFLELWPSPIQPHLQISMIGSHHHLLRCLLYHTGKLGRTDQSPVATRLLRSELAKLYGQLTEQYSKHKYLSVFSKSSIESGLMDPTELTPGAMYFLSMQFGMTLAVVSSTRIELYYEQPTTPPLPSEQPVLWLFQNTYGWLSPIELSSSSASSASSLPTSTINLSEISPYNQALRTAAEDRLDLTPELRSELLGKPLLEVQIEQLKDELVRSKKLTELQAMCREHHLALPPKRPTKDKLAQLLATQMLS